MPVAKNLVLVVQPNDVATGGAVLQKCLEDPRQAARVEVLDETRADGMSLVELHHLLTLLYEFFNHAHADGGTEAYAAQVVGLGPRLLEVLGYAPGDGGRVTSNQLLLQLNLKSTVAH